MNASRTLEPAGMHAAQAK